jgi:hypothetical protein
MKLSVYANEAHHYIQAGEICVTPRRWWAGVKPRQSKILPGFQWL